MTNRDGRAIIAIDLLRFACAMLVVAYHYGTGMMRSPSPHTKALLAGLQLPEAAVGATWFGWVGVELFFVVSGLVIARSALGASPGDFARRRVLRLAPAAWVGATLSAVLLATNFAPGGLVGAWLASVAFWPNPDWIDGAYWTLGIEVAFYLLVGWRLRRAADAAAIERLAIGLGLWSCAFWVGATVLPGSAGWIDIRTVQLVLLPHGCLFALGALLWAIDAGGVSLKRVSFAALFALAAVAEIVARSGERTGWMHVQASPLVPVAVFLTGLAVLASATRLQPFVARFVPVRTATTLGLATYPLYLIHQDAGAVILSALMRRGWSYEAAAAVSIALAVGAALLVAVRIEPLVRTGLAALMRHRRSPVAASA